MGNKQGKGEDAGSPTTSSNGTGSPSAAAASAKKLFALAKRDKGDKDKEAKSDSAASSPNTSAPSSPQLNGKAGTTNGTHSSGASTPVAIPVNASKQASSITSPNASTALSSSSSSATTTSRSTADEHPPSFPSITVTAPTSPLSSSLPNPTPTMITVTSTDEPPISIRGDTPLSHIPLQDGQDSFGEQFKATASAGLMSVDDFDLLKVIGKGSFGKVMQVRKKDNGRIYAMKVLKKEQLVARKQVAHTKTERKVLEEIHSPFIVQLRYAFQTENKLYMILDYFTGGELFFHLKSEGRFTEERARFYAAEIILAIEILHSNTIAYRDLKPENVLLDTEGHVRLTDFGLSKEGITRTQLTQTFCGTPEYLAPEVVQGQPYGLPVDWWSLGTILYEMLTGLPPFYNQNLHLMYEKIVRARVTYPPYLSHASKSLLAALLERDPEKRLGTAGDADEVKQHAFFASIDWARLKRREVAAPFVPSNTDGRSDTSNVDEEFTRETPRDTPIVQSSLRPGSNGQQVSFPGFTYVAPSSVGLGAVEGLRGESGTPQWGQQ